MSRDFTTPTTALFLAFAACGDPAPAAVPEVIAVDPPGAAPVDATAPVVDPPGGATVDSAPVDPPPSTPAPTVPPAEDAVLALLRPPPEGFSDLRAVLPGACFHIGYHRADNFTGAPLPGYGAPGAWLLKAPADALIDVQADVRAAGFTLIVYDSYRPYRGTQAMVAWATRTDQVVLLDTGYIARRSRHNHGDTIDLGLADPVTCEPIDMGTPWDTLDERSHTMNATGKALENRMVLKHAMENHGFHYYSKEWWHFQFGLEGTKARDVPYGCQEADEGAWTPPQGWDVAGWTAPAAPPAGPCL
jgi:D-alanyl-D-alanine dipeptidase